MKKFEIECRERGHRMRVNYDAAKAAERGELKCQHVDMLEVEGADSGIEHEVKCLSEMRRVWGANGFTMGNKDRAMLGEDL